MKSHSFRVDHFARKAKNQGYLTRAAYKLIEIDKKYKLFQPDQSCLDLGSAPGSWMQYCCSRVGPKGFVLGIDLNLINVDAIKEGIVSNIQNKSDDKVIEFKNIYSVQNDIFEWDYLSELARLKCKNLENRKQPLLNLQCVEHGFHHIISDMAANISGHSTIDDENNYNLWMQSLKLSLILGRYNSNLIVKGFTSEKMKEFMQDVKAHYKIVKTYKPDASRNSSNEMYIVAKQMRNKKPYFSLTEPNANVEEEEIQKMFNLFDYIKLQQDSENDQMIKHLINDKKEKITPKVDVSKSRLLSKLS